MAEMSIDSWWTWLVLGLLWVGVLVALFVIGPDPDHAGESPEQRRLRLARESHERTRLHDGHWTVGKDTHDHRT
jgi:hypothetical protein